MSPAPSLYQTPAAQPPAQRIEKPKSRPPDDRGQRQERQLRRAREPCREDRRQQEQLHRDGEAEGLHLRPVAFDGAAKAGVHAERSALRAVAEDRPDHERAEEPEGVHGALPATTGRPRARHSATPSPRAKAR